MVWAGCAPAVASMTEHPRSVIARMIDWPYQVVQPHWFGLGETGLKEQKETWLFWRGWGDIAATDPQPPPYVSRIRAVRAPNASDRDALKSRSHPGMMRAIAQHASVAAITPTPQPVFEEELHKLARRFSAIYGEENLPRDWAELRCDAPWWVAASIDYAPSPGYVAASVTAPAVGGDREAHRVSLGSGHRAGPCGLDAPTTGWWHWSGSGRLASFGHNNLFRGLSPWFGPMQLRRPSGLPSGVTLPSGAPLLESPALGHRPRGRSSGTRPLASWRRL